MGDFRSRANWALAAVTAGYFVSYPFSSTFAGGLISSACGAAMVGGLADWFAITALFRKPLGITWRTELIPRNRDKIIDILVHMVERELLTTDNIRKTLGRYSIPAVLLYYLNDCGGAAQVKDLFYTGAVQVVRGADRRELLRSLEILVHRELERIELAPLFAAAIDWSLRSGYGDKLVGFILQECKQIVSTNQAQEFFSQVFSAAQATYEQGMVRRKLVNLLAAEFVGITPAKAGLLAQQQVLILLEEWQQDAHPVRENIREWLLSMAESLKTDSHLRETIENWKKELLGKPRWLQEQLTAVLGHFGKISGPSLENWLQLIIHGSVDKWVSELENNTDLQLRVDQQVKEALMSWLDRHHHELGRLVRERLEALDGAALSAFVETRAGNDLQMIRINGSVVGGLLGMILYAATWWLR